MRTLRPSPNVLRWTVPAVVAAAVVTAVLTESAAPARPSDGGDLRFVSAIRTSDLPELTGTVRIRVADARPGLPGIGPASGAATAHVWIGSGNRHRVDVDSVAGHLSLYQDGPRLTVWDGRTVTRGSAASASSTLPIGADPVALTRSLLAEIDRNSTVTVGSSTTVAGRTARVVDIRPTDRHSLIGRIRLAVDVPDHLPLSLEVTARDETDPAVRVAFTRLHLGPPPAAALRFTPPAGAPVRTADPTGTTAPAPAVVGTGWRTVLVSRRPAGPALDHVIAGLPRVSGSWGHGRLLRSSLFTVLVTDDGRMLVGAVDPQTLYAAVR